MARPSTAYAQASRKDDDELVREHKGLIDKVCRRAAARCGGAVQPEELFSAAALGLLEAAQRFDPSREASFTTFAEHRIRGAVLDELRAMDPLPRRLRADTEKLKRDTRALEQRLGREATLEEVAEATALGLDEVVSLLQVSKPAESLTDVLVGSLPNHDPSALEGIYRKQLVQQLGTALSQLPQRTATLLSLHYVEELTYREIGQILSISEVRVCQIHKEALTSLKKALAEAVGE